MAALGRADAYVGDDIIDDLLSALKEADTSDKKIEALNVAIGNEIALPQGAKNILIGVKENINKPDYNPDDDVRNMIPELERVGGRRRRGKKSRKPRKGRASRRMTRRRRGGVLGLKNPFAKKEEKKEKTMEEYEAEQAAAAEARLSPQGVGNVANTMFGPGTAKSKGGRGSKRHTRRR